MATESRFPSVAANFIASSKDNLRSENINMCNTRRQHALVLLLLLPVDFATECAAPLVFIPSVVSVLFPPVCVPEKTLNYSLFLSSSSSSLHKVMPIEMHTHNKTLKYPPCAPSANNQRTHCNSIESLPSIKTRDLQEATLLVCSHLTVTTFKRRKRRSNQLGHMLLQGCSFHPKTEKDHLRTIDYNHSALQSGSTTTTTNGAE